MLTFSLLIGWVAGALANRLADYLPAGQWRYFLTGFHLRTLPHYLTLWWYPWRRGVCPHCGQPRPWRAPLLEAAMLLCFGLIGQRSGATPLLLAMGWFYTLFLLTVLVIDYEQRRVLNKLLVPVTIVVFLCSFVAPAPTPWQALLGGGVGFGLFLLLALLPRGAMGAGDVKLAGVIGVMTGYPTVLNALVLGMLFGGLGAIILLVSRRADRKSTMAYAPYLALGALVTLWTQLGLH